MSDITKTQHFLAPAEIPEDAQAVYWEDSYTDDEVYITFKATPRAAKMMYYRRASTGEERGWFTITVADRWYGVSLF